MQVQTCEASHIQRRWRHAGYTGTKDLTAPLKETMFLSIYTTYVLNSQHFQVISYSGCITELWLLNQSHIQILVGTSIVIMAECIVILSLLSETARQALYSIGLSSCISVCFSFSITIRRLMSVTVIYCGSQG